MFYVTFFLVVLFWYLQPLLRNLCPCVRNYGLDHEASTHGLSFRSSFLFSIYVTTQGSNEIMETDSIDDTSLIYKLLFEAGTTSANGGLLSDREHKRARTLISDTEKLMISLDQEIQGLVAKREEVAERLSRFRFAVAPYKRLPVEVLSDIFVRTLNGYPVAFPPANDSDSPWVLRQICSSWRQVALNEPRLWNNFRIGISTAHPPLPLIAKLFHSIIHPTGPLSINLDHDIDTSSEPVVDALLIPYISRIKNLDLDINFDTFGRLLQIRCQDFSGLESLRLIIHRRSNTSGNIDWSTMFEQCRIATVFQSAHLLRHLDICPEGNKRFSNNMLHIPFPWVGLTTLRIIDIRPLTLSELQRLLPKCTSLIDLDVRVFYDSPPQQGITANTTLCIPHLRRLRISGVVEAPHSLLSLQLPWKQFIELDLSNLVNLTFSEMHAILSHSNRAEKISICFPVIQSPCSTHLPPIELPRLKELWMYYDDPAVLDYLVVPAMEVLDLESPTLGESNLSSMILRSSCSISSFIFNCGNLDPRNMYRLLTLMPLLQGLEALDAELDQQVIGGISSGELLPQLEYLICQFEMPSLSDTWICLEMWRMTPAVTSDGACSTTLRQAWDICINYGDPTNLQEAFELFKELNEVHGTCFNLRL
ncbi:hypothetical protein FPV67DRAFT_461955 [Lyophyllum atratum]|nr:hypothetical protein FPV67DRAFT_461955 [Lyophyllum atratum]